MDTRAPTILRELIQRSKDAVKKIDMAALERKLNTPMRNPSQLADIEETPVATPIEPQSPGTRLSLEPENKLQLQGNNEETAQDLGAQAQGLHNISSHLSSVSSPSPSINAVAESPQPSKAVIMGRLDTIKLSAQVAREQLDAHGGESALLRQQVGEKFWRQ